MSGIAFAAFLARSYDALKDVNPNIKVVGVGLSPRGGDRPRAKSNISTSPVRFIQALGIGYQRMARNKPIMDVFGFHPYPARDRDPLHRGYRWPNAGVANLNRIKQAVWDIPRHGAADVPRGPARAAGARTSDRAAVAAGRAGEPAAGDSADSGAGASAAVAAAAPDRSAAGGGPARGRARAGT